EVETGADDADASDGIGPEQTARGQIAERLIDRVIGGQLRVEREPACAIEPLFQREDLGRLPLPANVCDFLFQLLMFIRDAADGIQKMAPQFRDTTWGREREPVLLEE